MNNYYVYMYLRCRDSEHGEIGSPYYVGKGRLNRAYNKTRRVRVPLDRKYVVFPLANATEEEAFAEECRLIALYGRLADGSGVLHNLSLGGEGASGVAASPEACRKRSEALRGIPKGPRSAEHSAKIARFYLGKKQSPELIEKRIAPLRGRSRPPFSDEWKRKISEAKRGKSFVNSGSFSKGLTPWNKGLKKELA